LSESIILVPTREDRIKLGEYVPEVPKLWVPEGAGQILRVAKTGPGLVLAVNGDLAEAIREATRDNPIAGAMVEAIESEIKKR
jgi:hypothetical protein